MKTSGEMWVEECEKGRKVGCSGAKRERLNRKRQRHLLQPSCQGKL